MHIHPQSNLFYPGRKCHRQRRRFQRLAADIQRISPGLQTETKQKIQEAEGGVLFIDEAYSLTPTYRNGYEQEAIATLIKEMEDHRNEICIILAGYTDEMEKLIELNPGFESRIQFTINFPDYNQDELLKIFKIMCRKEKYNISKTCEQILIDNFNIARKSENFGNGRYVRNLFEKIKFEQADRIIKNKSKALNNINKMDIENVVKTIELKKEEKRKIGFCN